MTQALPEELLNSLRARMLARAVNTLGDITLFLQNPEAHRALAIREAAHKLAGIAANLSYASLGSAARAVDACPLSCPLDAEELTLLEQFQAELKAAVEGAA